MRRCLERDDLTMFKTIVNASNVNAIDKDPYGWTTLHTVSSPINNEHDNPDYIHYIIKECGANVDVSTYAGSTALRLALSLHYKPNIRCVQALLEYKPDMNYVRNGVTYIDLAFLVGCHQIIKLLLERGGKYSFTHIERAPNWVTSSKKSANAATITIIGIKRYNRSQVLQTNNKDIIRFIAELIWQSRAWYDSKPCCCGRCSDGPI